MYKNISVFMLFVLLPLGGYAEIYKWKGEDGHQHYSDTPPRGKVTIESLKAKPRAVAPANPAVTANPNPAPVGLASSAKNSANKKSDVIESETFESRQNRAKACDVAKENLAKLKAGGSIYRDNEKGERQYLDETAIKKELESAQKEVDAICIKT